MNMKPDNNRDENQPLIEKIINNPYAQSYLNYIQNSRLVDLGRMQLLCIRAGIHNKSHALFFSGISLILCVVGAILGYLFIPSFVFEKVSYQNSCLTCLGMAIFGYFYPYIRLNSMAGERLLAFNRGFPDFLDLTLVSVDAGMSIDQVYVRMIDEFKQEFPVLSEEINLLSAELTYFLDPAVAYDNLSQRIPSDYVKAFSSVMIQAKKFGTPLSISLKALSKELRESEYAAIEKKAMSLPSKLTVPCLIFSLPVLFVVILAPGIMTAAKDSVGMF